ncbi:MAG: RNA polymerase sigma factor [Phycisphaerae bacterium]|nr:RNA polymerase sigma factor [Phycisphaerae bacterium]
MPSRVLFDRGAASQTSNGYVVGVMGQAAEDFDHDLIAAAQRGDRSALDALVRRHDRWVRGVVFSTLGRAAHVDDVVQQVWTNVWQQIGSLAEPRSWRYWLYRLARNAAIDAGQKSARDRRRLVAIPADGDLPSEDARPVANLVAEEERRAVLQAIRSLPAIYREPFVLRHLEDWSYAQIGDALGLPIDTVETRLVRARRLLREMLQTPNVTS